MGKSIDFKVMLNGFDHVQWYERKGFKLIMAKVFNSLINGFTLILTEIEFEVIKFDELIF